MKLKTSDGFILNGSFTKINKSTKGIIFLHGMTVGKDDEGIFIRAESKLNKLDFSTLRFDFRAHGKSSGNSIEDFTITGELLDLKTAIEFMLKQGIKDLGLAAASFGGSIVSLYVEDNRNVIRALFLANPVLDYEKGFLRAKTIWVLKYFANFRSRLKKFGFIEVGSRRFKLGKTLFDQMNIYKPYKSLDKYYGPLMVVHGDKDDIVPFENVFEHFQKLSNKNKEFKTIKGSEHGFDKEPYETEVVNFIVKFFEERI